MQNSNDHDLLIQLMERVKGIDEKLTTHLLENSEIIPRHETDIAALKTEVAVRTAQGKTVVWVFGGIISIVSFAINAAFRYLD